MQSFKKYILNVYYFEKHLQLLTSKQESMSLYKFKSSHSC